MERGVEPEVLVRLRNLDRGEEIDHRQHQVGKEEGIERRADDGEALHDEEMGAARQQSVGAAGIHRLGGEDAQQNHTQRAADSMHTPDIERIVPAELVFQMDRQIANHARRDPDDGSRKVTKQSPPPE